MRIRLILSFVFVVLISVVGVVTIARRNSASEIRSFMFPGWAVNQNVVDSLTDYYRSYGIWQGADALLAHGNTFGGGQGQMHGMGGGMMRQSLRLADESGEVVLDSSGNLPSGNLSPEELEAAQPLVVDGKIVGYLLGQSGMSFTRADETRLVQRLNQAALTAAVAVGGIALALALFLAYSLLRPVGELTRAAQKVASGDLTQRVPVRGSDELGILGKTFNRMADALQQAEESRRAMTADIAHELRNPLAVQRAALEAMQDGLYPLTGENLQPVLEQNQLLTRLVNDLRTLALADAGQLELNRVSTDLCALAERVVNGFRPQANSNGIQLTFIPCTYPSPESTRGVEETGLLLDPQRVEQILGNLLSNALRHTPQGGEVNVRVQYSGGQGLVQVHDGGAGIPPEALPHIFDRFYRADRSRSREQGGSGLGLTIARHLAEAHGGRLTAENAPGGGAVFTLIFPGG